ncbi:MAG: SBBP repeat-containing protein [Planctomycetia bacterium]|nr:SBBP repeat-containing protein [Planctomycetia bacterium]
MGGIDGFLAKYDSSGEMCWCRQIGTSDFDSTDSVAVDADGNAYVTGFTGFIGALGAAGRVYADAYVAKFDPSGNLLWSHEIGSSSYDQGFSVAVDATENVYVTGVTEGSLGGPNAGDDDVFLAKYDSLGNLLWCEQMGTSAWEWSGSVAVDRAGDVYISGSTEGSLGGPNTGGPDIFLMKFVVPEPSFFLLLGTGGLCLLASAWRRRGKRGR